MNSKAILALAAFAAIASTGVRADEAGPQYSAKFESTRTRAEVQAEAVAAAANRDTEFAGVRSFAAPVKSGLDARTVRSEAAQAVRLGQISYGDAGGL